MQEIIADLVIFQKFDIFIYKNLMNMYEIKTTGEDYPKKTQVFSKQEEIWRDIKDYEGLYQVSNLGRVKSLERYAPHNMKTGTQHLQEKILTPVKLKCNKGTGYYYQVTLRSGTSGKRMLVHRLVGMAFPDLVEWTDAAKGKPFKQLQINHKDQNKTNNNVNNLQWCTNRDNNVWGGKPERHSEIMTNRKDLSKPVLQYTLDGQFVAEYPSIREASRQTGICSSGIYNCCKGNKRYSHAGGYVWFYKEDEIKYVGLSFVNALKEIDYEKEYRQALRDLAEVMFDMTDEDFENNEVKSVENAEYDAKG